MTVRSRVRAIRDGIDTDLKKAIASDIIRPWPILYDYDLGFITKFKRLKSFICGPDTCVAFDKCERIRPMSPDCTKMLAAGEFIAVRYASNAEIAAYLKYIAERALTFMDSRKIVRAVLGECVISLGLTPDNELIINSISTDNAPVKIIEKPNSKRKLQLKNG